MASDKVVLYGWYRSSCAWRVRIALAWKNIQYENHPVDLKGGEHHGEEFSKLNPLQQVPVLLIDGKPLGQSVAIVEYLEETRPDRPLLPQDPKQRVQVRRVVESIVSGIQPHQNLSGIAVPGGIPQEWVFAYSADWGRYWIEKGFKALESILEETSGKYCVGDEVTIADICLVPQVYNSKLFKVNLDLFPNIKRINEALVVLEEFKQSHPSAQPDCEEAYKQIN